MRAKIKSAELGGRRIHIQTSAKGVGNGGRLFKDLLKHEVWVGAFIGVSHSVLYLFNLHIGAIAEGRADVETIGVERDHFLILENDHSAGVGGEGLSIAREKVFPFAHTDDQGTAATCSHH